MEKGKCYLIFSQFMEDLYSRFQNYVIHIPFEFRESVQKLACENWRTNHRFEKIFEEFFQAKRKQFKRFLNSYFKRTAAIEVKEAKTFYLNSEYELENEPLELPVNVESVSHKGEWDYIWEDMEDDDIL